MHFKVIVCAIVVLGMVQKTVRQNTQPAATGSSGGVVVVVDPTTRQIRQATPAEIGALTAPLALRATTPTTLTTIQGPGGAVGIALGPEFEMHMVATKTSDGKLQIEEVNGQKAARERVSSGQYAKAADGK